MNDSPKTILVVDDIPDNIDVLVGILSSNYRVKVAINGELALQLATSEPLPDLILLDIMMPGMDGYEVCRKLKEHELTRETPVIFVTGKAEIADETAGFDAGAVDFIAKPVSPPIVLKRVETQLKLKAARDVLTEKNVLLQKHMELQEQVERITRHDIRNPLSSIFGYASLLRTHEPLTEKGSDYCEKINKSAHRILEIVDNSLSLYKIETGVYVLNPVPVNICDVIFQLAQETEPLAHQKKLHLMISMNGKTISKQDELIVPGEELLYYSMLANLIKNALEASPEDEAVTIDISPGKETQVICIQNQGVVPESIRQNFFEKYVTAGKAKGTGIGTYSAKLMANTLNCLLEMQTSDEEGTRILLSLPSSGFET